MEDNLYKNPFGVNNQIFFCGVPLRLDSYGGCQHQCRYCFARSAELTNQANLRREHKASILVADTTPFNKLLAVALDQGLKRNDINIEWLRRRVPIHWGGMSDPFQPCERRYKVTANWMDRLNWYNYPVAISTKGTALLTEPEYMQKLKKGNYVVQISLIGKDDELLKKIEPGVPKASERLEALRKLADAGIWTAVRIQPMFPNSIFEDELAEFVRLLSTVGVKHVIAEGYKIPVRSSAWMKELHQLMPKVEEEYRAYSAQYFGFEKLLPSWRKWKYIKVIRDVCHENGMTFGAADNDMRDFGDTICCCGLDNLPGFENFWRYQSSQAVEIAKEKGFVSLSDMQQYWHGGVESMDSGNILNSEMYEELYGYKKGKAKEKPDYSGGLLGIQDGDMRREARKQGIRYTAKYCVDWMWNAGGDCSPEVMASMKKSEREGEVVYEYSDPIPRLEAQQVNQTNMFDYIEGASKAENY